MDKRIKYCVVVLFVMGCLWNSPITPITKAASEPLATMRTGDFDLSPDERYFAYTGITERNYIAPFIVDRDTGVRRALYVGESAERQYQSRISPLGDKVFFAKERRQLFRVGIVSGSITLRLLLAYDRDEATRINFEQATFTPDGRHLLFTAGYNPEQGKPFILNTQSDVLSPLLPDAWTGEVWADSLRFSADSQTVYLIYELPMSSRLQVLSVPVAGGEPTVLSPVAVKIEDLVFTPDETQLWYIATTSVNPYRMSLYRVQLEGTSSPEVVSGPYYRLADLALSPDGAFAFFSGRTSNGQSEVYRVEVATLARTTLLVSNTLIPDTGTVLVSPTGTRVVVATLDGNTNDISGEIYSIDYGPAVPGDPILLTEQYGTRAQPNGQTPRLVISPDGLSLFFSEVAQDIYLPATVRLDGASPARQLSTEPVWDIVAPTDGDGAFLIVGTANAQKLLYGLGDGQTRRLYEDPVGSTLQVARVLPEQSALVLSYTPTAIRAEIVTQEPAPRFTVHAAPTIGEGFSGTLVVEMIPPATQPITVTYEIQAGTALPDVDFTVSPAALVFAAGQATATLTITAFSDAVDEPLESAVLQLTTAATSQPLTATISIADTVIPVSDAPARFGAASSNGRYVLYEEESPQGYALLRRDVATHEVQTLHAADGTLVGAGRVYLSPDDSAVLYETTTSVRMVPLAGGASREILSQNGCPLTVTFTPTSDYATLLLDCAGETPDRLVSVRVSDGAVVWERDLPSIAEVSMQPEGDYVLATQRGTDGVQQVVVRSVAGTSERIVTAPIGQPIAFVAFTTNDTVTYVVRAETDATIYRLDLRSDERTALGTIFWNGTLMALSQTRDVLIYVNYESVSRFLLNSGTDQLINAWYRDGDYSYELRNPVASPTGDRVAFIVQQTFCHRYGCDVDKVVHTVTFSGVLEESWPSGNDYLWFSSDSRYLIAGGVYIDQLVGVAIYDLHTREAVASPLFPLATELVAGTRRAFVQTTEDSLVTVAVNRKYTDTRFSDVEGLSWVGVGAGDQLYFYDHTQKLYVAGDRLLPLSFTTESVLVAEGSSALITVTLETTPLNPVTVDYSLTGGTATEGDDFTFTPGTLTFAPFERTKTFTVDVVDDGVVESVETAEFTLSNIAGGSAGEQTTYTLNIADEVYEQRLPILQR